MAGSEQRRQKKVMKQRARRKEYERQKAVRDNQGLSAAFQRSARFPVLGCFHGASLFSEGIGSVTISRRLPSRQVVFAVFLLDIWCLGVKDSFGRIVPMREYEDFLEKSGSKQELIDIAPEYARKLIEECVAYARRLGIPPHRDYADFASILSGIDSTLCRETFEFGQNGMPFYVAGPHDDLERQQQVCSILRSTVGPENFRFLLTGRPGDAGLWLGNSQLGILPFEEQDEQDEGQQE